MLANKIKKPPQIKGSGYVVESLEAALWAFYHSDTFEEGALLAVNLGDDADTTGAVYGQLAGAYYGVGQIPAKWRNIIWERELIENFATEIYYQMKTMRNVMNYELRLTSDYSDV